VDTAPAAERHAPGTRAGPAPGYQNDPDYRIVLVPCAKRIRASFAGHTVFDIQNAVVMCETGHIALYYVPRDDADMTLMNLTDHSTLCPFKGHTSYYTLRADGREAENAVWSYEAPYDEAAAISGWLAFYWNQLDRWYEEDEEVFIHARDPHVRIDIVESHRPVEVIAGGETIARTTRARFLFETGDRPRYYIPREDVAAAALFPSELRTGYPYKGTASYHHIAAGGVTIEDVVWYYPEPVDEVRRIGGYLCFYPERVGTILVDGKPAP
tara:strand:- start:903 stop:1709 length:807 start_codon:yes stop_codon:yes gene_type:complete